MRAPAPPPSPPADGSWAAGFGLVHPTGGYDEIVPRHGGRMHRLRSENHREDGPAFVADDGGEGWYLHGKLHREDGPAMLGTDGEMAYYVDGKAHRADGPAVIRADGGEEWWFEGLRHRLDGPAAVIPGYVEEYFVRNELHREDGPARTYYFAGSDSNPQVSSETYSVHGVFHRLDGPARVYYSIDGAISKVEYRVHGEEYTEQRWAAFREALDAGSPIEWAIAYADGVKPKRRKKS